MSLEYFFSFQNNILALVSILFDGVEQFVQSSLVEILMRNIIVKSFLIWNKWFKRWGHLKK